MRYVYSCGKKERCKIVNLPPEFFEGKLEDLYVDLESRLNVLTEDGNIDIEKTPLTWFVSHLMRESPTVRCPVCNNKAKKVIQRVQSYLRGNCYLDIAGCKKDMNIFKLQNDDPYGHMRQPGEKEDLITKLKRGKKAKTQTYVMPSKAIPKSE